MFYVFNTDDCIDIGIEIGLGVFFFNFLLTWFVQLEGILHCISKIFLKKINFYLKLKKILHVRYNSKCNARVAMHAVLQNF